MNQQPAAAAADSNLAKAAVQPSSKVPQPVSILDYLFAIEQFGLPSVLALLWHLLHLAFALAFRSHFTLQALCASLPKGLVGDGLSRVLDNFCSDLICPHRHWQARQQSRIACIYPLHDIHHWLLHLLQCFLHQVADIYVSRVISIKFNLDLSSR